MIYPESIPYMQVVFKKVMLPKGNPVGKGIMIYPLTKSIDETIRIITNTDNFISGLNYKFYYYNLLYSGKLYNKRYIVKDYKERLAIYDRVKEEAMLNPVPLKPSFPSNFNRNVFFEMSKYMEIYEKITSKLQPMYRVKLFWNYLESILLDPSTSGYKEKYVLIDASNYVNAFQGKLGEKLSNPLFMFYYTLFKDFTIANKITMDFLIYCGNRCMKINFSQMDKKSYMVFRMQLKKLLAGSTHVDIDDSMNEELIRKEEQAEVIADNLRKSYNFTGNDVKEEVITKANLKKSEADKTSSEKEEDKEKEKTAEIQKKIETKVKEAQKEVEKEKEDSGEESNETKAGDSDKIVQKTEEKINEDPALLEELYKQAIKEASPVSRASSARDEKIRKEQEKLKVKGTTIEEIKKIQASHTPIPTKDVSKVIKTTNPNMKDVKFSNFAKLYNEKVMTKDIVNSFTSLNDKSIPMTIIKIDVQDTSDELNYKETYTVLLEDVNRKRHTIKVDIPKFIDDRFMWLGGAKKIILNQEFLLPVIKSGPDEVQIVTNRNKMFIKRYGTKSISAIERLTKLCANNEELLKYFKTGYVFLLNQKYITTVEYDDLSKKFENFHNKDVMIYFNQEEVHEIASKKGISIPSGEILIGFIKDNPLFINEDTQKTKDGLTITDIIISTLPDNLKEEFESIRAPKRLMYAAATTMKQNVPIALLVSFWIGLHELLTKLKIKYRLERTTPSKLASNEAVIRFSDCVLVYEENVPISLVMNGFSLIETKNYKISDFETAEPFIPFFIKVYGKANITGPLMNTYEFTIDPITKEVLTDMNLPTEMADLTLYATSLLADSQFKHDYDQNLARVRNNETVAAILYDQIAAQYVLFKNSNGRKKLSLPRDCVIKELLKLKTVEEVSTLSPLLELERTHTVMYKGWRGINLEEAYTQDQRVYDKSMIGIIGLTSSPDGGVGVNRTLTMEPNIQSARGYTKVETNYSNLKDINLFSPAELLCPMGPSRDDPTRTGHGVKQSKHVIPVKKSSPVLMSNGSEEICRFSLSSDFVINAQQDGKVIDVNEKLGIIVCEYKDGTHQAIDLNPKPVKNGGGGFYLSNRLVSNLKIGDTFKRDELLAWHKDYFKNSKFNSGRFCMGTLVKFAIMSSYNTYEDSTVITEKMSDDMSTEMEFNRQVVVGKNANVDYIIKEGAEIDVGDSLIQFDTSFEDNELNMLLSSISEDLKEGVLEGSRNDIRSKIAGKVENIKIYSTVDLKELSPSLQKIVGDYYKKINAKKSMLNKYDPESSIVKCGILFDEPTGKVDTNKYGVLKGQKAEDSVLFEFYVKHEEPLEIGSKIAYFTGLKTTIGEVIKEGYEPYSEFRKDEEVSTLLASNSILSRMTPSILLSCFGNKCIVELKRKLKDIFETQAKSPDLRKTMTTLIYNFFSAMDKTGANTKKYKELFEPMTDAGFKKWFGEFFADEYAYLILDIIDYERSIYIKDIERAAKVLGIPLMEHVYLPHITMDKNNIVVTKVPVPVGYVHVKRTQQTIAKKNGLSTSIDARSSLTGQVTSSDKNGRQSDLENAMLVSLGLTNTLRELNGPRSDDMVMKREMLNDINKQGYVNINTLTNDVNNKTTLNTVNTFMLGMGLNTDLVTKGLMLKSTVKEET